MVLVDEAVRGRGIGTRLVEHAVTHLRRRSIPTLRLDATSLGRPVYEKLGFEPEYEVARWEGTLPAATTDPPLARSGIESEGAARDSRMVPLTADQLPAVAKLDRQVTGTDRQRLIRHLSSGRRRQTWVVTVGETTAGYAMLRPGSARSTSGRRWRSIPRSARPSSRQPCNRVRGSGSLSTSRLTTPRRAGGPSRRASTCRGAGCGCGAASRFTTTRHNSGPVPGPRTADGGPNHLLPGALVERTNTLSRVVTFSSYLGWKQGEAM